MEDLSVEYTWSQEKLRRKINQAWELAGCARQDGDKSEEKRRTDEARRLTEILKELYGRPTENQSECSALESGNYNGSR